MATLEELKSVVRDSLETRGVLGEIKGRVRAEVFHALNDNQDANPRSLSNENMFINELIAEYLSFNRYRYAASVLRTESGMPSETLDRDFMKRELNIVEDNRTASVPLLYGLVGHFLSGAKRIRENRPPTEDIPPPVTNTAARMDREDKESFVVHSTSSQ